MDNILNYETYLFVSKKKIIISVNSNDEQKVYYNEIDIDYEFEVENFQKLDFFLNQNIFKIEKKIQSFVEKIIIILDLDIFFSIGMSIKKDNLNKHLNIQNLKHLLNEAKESCKQTLDQKKVIHMLINNYKVDNKNYSSFPDNIRCKNYSLDLELICISENFIKRLEIILKKYHISLNRVLNANYIERFYTSNDRNVFSMAKKIIEGHNPNEVMLLDKIDKNQGFFEKFFNFFN